jgi:predicted RNA-binding Zn ribbon-like protein
MSNARQFISLDFMNSLYRDYRGNGNDQDRLQNADWLKTFLHRWGLQDRRVPSKAAVDELRRLRSTLWRLGELMVRKRRLQMSDLAMLNRFLAAAPLRRRLKEERRRFAIGFVPARRDWTWVESEIAADFAQLLASQDLRRRIKLCANRDCRWIFYDATKSQTRNWCTPTCGNLMKVRRFRQRKQRRTKRGKI